MDHSLKLFLMGFAIAIITTIVLDKSEYNTSILSSFISDGFELWKLIFLITMVTTVPFLAIDPLKKRFTRKNLLPFQFLAGNGTGFLFMGLVSIITSLVT
jgi:hypothetical protein